MANVLLVNPPDSSQGGFSSAPLGLAYLAGTLCAHGIDVEIVDGYLDGMVGIKAAIDAKEPEWVGVTCYTPGRHHALEVLHYAKSKGAKTIIGGAHATIMWEQIVEHYGAIVDYCVRGEGESTLLDIVRGWNPPMYRQGIENPDDIPYPAWHLLDLKRYPRGVPQDFRGVELSEPRIPVIFSRGCRGSCGFCSTWWVWGGWRHRSPENMLGELQLLHDELNIHHLVFQDDSLTLDVEATKQMCRLILSHGLKFGIFGTTRTDACDQEMFDLMSQAGFYGVSMGIESGSQRMLDLMGKKNTVTQNEAAINMAHHAGLAVCALILQGYPGETEEDRRLTREFLNRTRPVDVGTLGVTWILPGTKLYNQYKREGRISDDYWLGPDPVFTA